MKELPALETDDRLVVISRDAWNSLSPWAKEYAFSLGHVHVRGSPSDKLEDGLSFAINFEDSIEAKERWLSKIVDIFHMREAQGNGLNGFDNL